MTKILQDGATFYNVAEVGYLDETVAEWRTQGFSDDVIAEALWQRMTGAQMEMYGNVVFVSSIVVKDFDLEAAKLARQEFEDWAERVDFEFDWA